MYTTAEMLSTSTHKRAYSAYVYKILIAAVFTFLRASPEN